MQRHHVSDSARSILLQTKTDFPPGPEDAHKLHRAMIALSEYCIEWGQTQIAADTLAFLLLRGNIDPDSFMRADELFADLESRICPRVILDAREFAADMDLLSMLEYLLDLAPRQQN
ncbi:MAG: hypothetical protein OXG49_00770 [Chloroflexi bacterium]|nr:hypothetical protein [Chloroflexota bacterium]